MANLISSSCAEHPGVSCEHFRDGRCLLADIQAAESLCLHCLGDATGLFRARFAAQKAQRELYRRLANIGVPGRFPCTRYGLEVDELFCQECRRNPALKQSLGSGRRRREPCAHRGERVGEAEVLCCGGRKKLVPTYRCGKQAEPRHEQDCARCKEYKAPSPHPLPRGEGKVACATWPDVWQCHKGKTALILACGPSVLLPGEDPSPETVDPRVVVAGIGVPAPVVISTNWAWKWYEEIIDYQVSYDPTPCLGWRPAHVKLLTPVRPKATQAVLEKAKVYSFFPACDYGDIAQGKPLPCSRNSGYAALAFAAYAGCSTIKVLGMDFGPRDGSPTCHSHYGDGTRMHFYHESDFDVNRRVKSFGRQKERVQGDLSKLLAAVRATGAKVENLSPHSELSWE